MTSIRALAGLIVLSLFLFPPAATDVHAEDYAATWELPGDALGRRLGHLLEVMSRDDESFTRDFVETVLHPDFLEMGPVEMHLEQFAAIRKELGAFEVDDIDLPGPYRADLVLRSPNGDRLALHVELEEIEPYRLVGVGLRPYDADLEIPEFADLTEVHDYVNQLAKANKFAGVVLVEQEDASRFLRAYGFANKERNVPNTPETRFNVGSITKSFTALAVMQLVDQGRIGLDDPMSKHLSGFPGDIADRVTVRHLLRMESGYGDYFGSPLFRERRPRIRTVDDYLQIFRNFPIDFEPGTDRRYSNTGYTLLGGIIEAASGMTYFDYVEEHIFRAGGMMGSSFPDYAVEDDRMAMGYTNDGPSGESGFTRTNLDFFAMKGNPSGGSYSTAEDLLIYNRALRNNKLLSEASTTLLMNFFEEKKERPSRRGVAGGAPGVSAVNLEDADLGVTVIVLSNHDEPLGEKIGEAVFKMLAK